MSLFWIPTSRRLSLIVSRILHLRLSLTTNWNGKLKKSSIHGSAVVVSFTRFAGRTILHPMILGNPPATSPIRQTSSTSSTPATPTNLVLLLVLVGVLVLVLVLVLALVLALVLQPNMSTASQFVIWQENTPARRSSLPEREVLSGFHVMTRTPCHDEHGRGAPMLIGAHISQVASSTPFLCCSRFSPIAFNLSNTKSSIQLLHVLDCPFRRPKPTRSYPTRSPLQDPCD